MDEGMIIPIALFAIMGFVAIVGIIAGLISTWLRSPRRVGNPLSEDEMRMVQEIHNDLARMESRLEALEAILLDRANVAR